MPLPIAQLGQPILRQQARDVSLETLANPNFQQLLDDMLATVESVGGAGLAGPQVFQDKRVFLAGVLPGEEEDYPVFEIFINPRVTPLNRDFLMAWEGCLSFQELLVLVPRYQAVRIDYWNRQGDPKSLELQDWPARIVQHEYDHLDGILTIDRAPETRFIIKASELEAFQLHLEED